MTMCLIRCWLLLNTYWATTTCHACIFTFTPYIKWKKEKEKSHQGAVPRWQNNRMGRQLSPLKIHQKIICNRSKFHKKLLNAGRETQIPREMHGPPGTVPSWCTWEPGQLGPVKCTLLWAMETPVWSIHWEHPPHMLVAFAWGLSPSPQHNWAREPE